MISSETERLRLKPDGIWSVTLRRAAEGAKEWLATLDYLAGDACRARSDRGAGCGSRGRWSPGAGPAADRDGGRGHKMPVGDAGDPSAVT